MEFSCETPFLLEGEQVVEELSSNSQTGLSQSEVKKEKKEALSLFFLKSFFFWSFSYLLSLFL